jgi:hypothetical protein
MAENRECSEPKKKVRWYRAKCRAETRSRKSLGIVVFIRHFRTTDYAMAQSTHCMKDWSLDDSFAIF